MGIEHLGQIKAADDPNTGYQRTSLPGVSSLWTTVNERLVEIAIQAVQDNRLQRVMVHAPGRPGTHGDTQARSWGLGAIARRLGIAGASTMGLMAAYWSTKARIDYLDADHFVKQVAAMSQICGELMNADVETIRTMPT